MKKMRYVLLVVLAMFASLFVAASPASAATNAFPPPPSWGGGLAGFHYGYWSNTCHQYVVYRNTNYNYIVLSYYDSVNNVNSFVVFQADGNLVFYKGNHVVWASGIHSNATNLNFQCNGDVAVWAGGTSVWNMGSAQGHYDYLTAVTGQPEWYSTYFISPSSGWGYNFDIVGV